MKPHYAKTLILDGDGKGSGGVWAGGDQVSGHQGGILSGFHRKVNINDPRAVSLRGVTIPEGLLQRIVANYATIAGKLTQTDGGKIGGVPTDRLDLKVADPACERRHDRGDSVRLERDALADPADHVRRLADRGRRNRQRSQDEHRPHPSRLSVLAGAVRL